MRTLITVLTVTVLTIGTAGQALADPYPVDGNEPVIVIKPLIPTLPTLPFALGEVDLASLGVSDTELLGVGVDGSDPGDAWEDENDDPEARALSAHEDSNDDPEPPRLVVDDDGVQCPNRDLSTIQAAVNAVTTTGTRIKVCPGTYTEQVTISGPTRNGLRLFSQKRLEAIIKAPVIPITDLVKAIVRVSGSQNVTVRGFTITGPGSAGCNSIRFGIRVDGGGSATIRHNHITKIRDNPFSGCQNGVAVQVGRKSENTTGSAIVRHNLIDEYQKNGPTVDNTGSTAEVRNNEIVGAGPTTVIAQNGVQISRGAHGDVHHNKVSGNVYTPAGTEATGVLLFELNGGVTVRKNKVFENELGIALAGGSTPTQGVQISNNRTRNNTEDGLRAFADTMGNTFNGNKSTSNGVHDCHDDSIGSGTAGTANTWKDNKGKAETPAGICKRADEDDD